MNVLTGAISPELTLENDFLEVRLLPTTGMVSQIKDKVTGKTISVGHKYGGTLI